MKENTYRHLLINVFSCIFQELPTFFTGQRNIEIEELVLEYLPDEGPIANPHVERNEIRCAHASHRFPWCLRPLSQKYPGYASEIYEI